MKKKIKSRGKMETFNKTPVKKYTLEKELRQVQQKKLEKSTIRIWGGGSEKKKKEKK